MAIQFLCPNGHELSAPEDRAGKPGKCPKCQTEFLVPELDEEDSGAGEPGDAGIVPPGQIVFLCPNGHKLNGPASLKGKPGKCPHCGAKFLIPGDDEEEEAPVTVVQPVSGSSSGIAAVTAPAQAPTASPAARQQPEFSAAFLNPPSAAEPSEPTIRLASESLEQVQEAELIAPPLGRAQHSLHHVLSWLCQQRQDSQPILVRLKDGEVLQIDYFAPELSRSDFAVFALREANDRHSLMTIAWSDISRAELHKVRALPEGLFI